MPRPKNYDRDEAVKKACSAFWQHGYGALGVRVLEQLSGLNRFAIQTEFGGKEGLFLETLDKYTQETETHLLKSLRDGDLSQIEALFNQLVTLSQEPAQAFGCLMVNTVVENAVLARVAIKERTDRHFEKLEKALRTALSRAKTNGQIANDFDVEEGIAFLVGSTMGVQLIIRRAGSIEAAQPYVNMLIKTIESWRTGLVSDADRAERKLHN